MAVTNATIQAVNGLTARWAGASEGGTVFSAAGVWPLLAFLADGAAGAAREELAEAVGLPAGESASAARELLTAMGRMRGLDSALGLWTKRTLELRERWQAGLPTAAHGVLTGDKAADQAALDAWAAKRTDGLIEKMPVRVTRDTEMVLASALALRTEWLSRFEDWPMWPETGPWADRKLAGLHRHSALLDRVGVADTSAGQVTELKVYGDNAIDVHLLLGEEEMTPGQVLGAGVDILARRVTVLPGPHLPYGEVGPGLSVIKVRSSRPNPPTLNVATVGFDIHALHNLLELPELFGLSTAMDQSRGHFPGIVATTPLAVESAEQAAMARFTALGFRAAAVTAFGATAGGVPQLRWITTRVDARFDRPFGFLAVHRHSRLVLSAGWVTDPAEYPEEPEYDEDF